MWTLIIDNGNTEVIKQFDSEADAREAWRDADHRVQRKEWHSADLRNPSGRRMSYIEQT